MRIRPRKLDVPSTVKDEIEIDDWPVPSAEVRLELERRLPAWPDQDDER